jgi:hypothetical protein
MRRARKARSFGEILALVVQEDRHRRSIDGAEDGALAVMVDSRSRCRRRGATSWSAARQPSLAACGALVGSASSASARRSDSRFGASSAMRVSTSVVMRSRILSVASFSGGPALWPCPRRCSANQASTMSRRAARERRGGRHRGRRASAAAAAAERGGAEAVERRGRGDQRSEGGANLVERRVGGQDLEAMAFR